MDSSDIIIQGRGVGNRFGEMWVHKDLDIEIKRSEIIAIAGGSGAGKTTLLRAILMLRKPTEGEIRVFDTSVTDCSEQEAYELRRRWGVMFQQGALFSSLTVLENIMFPMKTFTKLDFKLRQEVAMLKLLMVGLPQKAAQLYPAELSGGMLKRVAVARALSLDPELLFLDEPTSGLDPHSASALDFLIKDLRDALGLTIVVITHDMDTLWDITDRVAFIGEHKVIANLPIKELVKHPHPMIQDYFSSARARARMGAARGS